MTRHDYFHGRVEEASTKHGTFVSGDKVRILSCDPKFPTFEGEILYLIHSNHGKGRVYAVVKIGDRQDHVPLGSCRHIKETQ